MATNKTFEQALPVGYKLTGGDRDYEIEKVLGQGGFGITYRVKAHVRVGAITVTTHFAVKEYFPSVCWRDASTLAMLYPPTQQLDVQEGLGDFLGEGQRLQSICKLNPHIVNVNEVFEANGTAYFVMEYLSGGDITGMVARQGALSEAAMLSIITPVAEALQCLHENMMLHLDIKPENIVMRQSDDGRPDVPVLIDFGVSVHFRKDGKPTTKKPSKGVTPGYSPAEQFAGVSRFDPRLDIYALSATCYYMLTGRSPKSAFEVDTAELRRDLSGRASDRTIDAIVQGMSREASGRPATIAQFLKGFKATCALRIGSVVHGNYQNYAIVSVIDETDDDIHYAASTGQDATASGQPGGTAKVAYDLWSQRLGGNVLAAGQGAARPEWQLPNQKAGFAPGQFGFKSQKPGVIDCEYFVDGGVEYVAVRRDYKPTPAWMLQMQQLWHDHSRKALMAAGALAVCGAGYYLIDHLLESNRQKHLQAAAQLQEAIDTKDKTALAGFAELDSVRAFGPLIDICMAENDTAQVLKWAQRAVDCDETGAQERDEYRAMIDRYTVKEQPIAPAAEPEVTPAEDAEVTQPAQEQTDAGVKQEADAKAKAAAQAKAEAEAKAKKEREEKQKKEAEERRKQEAAKNQEDLKSSKATEAYYNGNEAELKRLARKGNAKAQEICRQLGWQY